MDGIWEGTTRDSMAPGRRHGRLQFRTEPHAHLYHERILTRVALQPEQPGVHVPHQGGAAEDVRAETALRTLGDAAVGACRREPGEQDAQLAIDPTPRGVQGRLVPRSEENRVGRTVARAPLSDAQGRIVDLQAERSLLRVAAEPDAKGGRASFEWPTHGDQEPNGRPERAVE